MCFLCKSFALCYAARVMRTNVYQEKILAVLQKSHLLSIPAIQARIAKANFSTIFRNLEQLCTAGKVRKVTISKDTILYELAEPRRRHDHFVCTDCGAIESIHLPKRILPRGTVADVLVRGTCGDCTK